MRWINRAISLVRRAFWQITRPVTLGMLSLFGIYTNFFEGKSDHVVVFAGLDFTLGDVTNLEIEASGLFDLRDLPEKTSPGSRRRIDEYLAGHGTPATATW